MCTYVAVFLYGVRWRHNSAKFRTAFFGQFRTSLRKDTVANYASIGTLFSTSVTGPDALCNALNISQIHLYVAPQNSKIAVAILQSVNNRTQSLREILRMVIIAIYTVVQKNAPNLADYNYDPVQSIVIIFSKLFVNDHKSCIVINTILGRLPLDPADMHCPSWDDAYCF